MGSIEITYAEFKLLLRIYLKKIKRTYTINQFCSETGIYRFDPCFYNLRKKLLECEIIGEGYSLGGGNEKTITINNRKLDVFIRKTEHFKLVGKFIERSKPLEFNY